VWPRLLRLLRQYPSAVVAFVDDDGYPASFRCHPVPDEAGEVLVLVPPAGVTPQEGRGGLLCHSHDERLWRLRSFIAGGALEVRDDRWVLVPDRLTPGMGHGGPLAMVRMVRRGRRTAAAYLARRGWEAPAVEWERLAEVKRQVVG
jgi:hypothetical protein